MTTQQTQATRFADLHVPGDPLIIYNIWDAGSAKALESAGAKAIATGSKPVALAHGYEDGEALPLEWVLENAKRVVQNVSLPVSIDFESGYGKSPEEVATSVTQLLETGAVGINFEDQIMGESGLYTIEAQQARIAAVRAAATGFGVSLFINARTDIFLKTKAADLTAAHLSEAIARAVAYAEAGANGLFAPGITDATMIETLCRESPVPINVMKFPGVPASRHLADLGVARISYGPGPYNAMLQAFKTAAQAALNLEG